MQIARVIGDVVATRKDDALVGLALHVVQPLDAAHQPVGRPIVAADAAGAGVGENVFFVRGREAAFPFYPAEPPVDAAIVGIVDHWSAEGAVPAAPRQ
jgi:ethanolamine utilization protein EutN